MSEARIADWLRPFMFNFEKTCPQMSMIDAGFCPPYFRTISWPIKFNSYGKYRMQLQP